MENGKLTNHRSCVSSVLLCFQVLHNNSNYPLSNLDGGIIGTKAAPFLDLSKDDDRDMTDLSDMKSNASTAAAVAAAAAATEMSFPTFVPDYTSIATLRPVFFDCNTKSADYFLPVEQKVLQPNPTIMNHHLSKHFHPWHPHVGFFEGQKFASPRKSPRPAALMHNFLQAGGAHAGGTLNLSTNQYHQTQAHLLHQQHHHSRPN